MRTNPAFGKQILALVRDADFTHAGEIEAIELAHQRRQDRDRGARARCRKPGRIGAALA